MPMQCPLFTRHLCRSCDLLDQSYSTTLQLKENHLRGLFSGQDFRLRPTIGMSRDADQSRSKAKLAVFGQKSEIRFGYFNSEGIPQPMETCPLHMEGINALLFTIRNLLKKNQLVPYDLTTKKGEIKYLLISKSHSNGDFLVRVVVRASDCLDRLKLLALELQTSHPLVKVITANIQPIHQAVLEGDEEQVLSATPAIQHRFDEFTLTLGPRSFFQVTPEIAQALYRSLAQEVAQDRPETLLDLYCGVGAFSFYASRTCKQVTGIEVSKEAIQCALESRKINHTPHIDFQALDVENYLAILKRSQTRFEAVVVNPPRRGLNEKIISSLLEHAPRWIYYSSCNAETLAKDVNELAQKYEVRSMQIFDMFPYTRHFETLACLELLTT